MMRALELALFLFVLSSTLGMVDSLDLFTTATIVDNPGIRIEDIQDVKIGDDGLIVYEEDLSLSTIAKIVLDVIVFGILGIIYIAPTLLSKFGVPLVLVVVLQAGIIFIYVIAIAQIVSNRSFKNYA